MSQPSLSYNILKFALQKYGCAPCTLGRDEYEAVLNQAEAECDLQKKVLASEEGGTVVVPARAVQDAVAALAGRYGSPQDFRDDLAANGMDRQALAAALEVELLVEAIMAQVAARVAPPTEAEVAAHLATVDGARPEQRRLRHILITINDQFPENSRSAALARIEKLHGEALAPGADFTALAQRYSECPSALQGGSVGPVTRKGIYPSLAEVLFAMTAGQVSAVVESAMGFHIMRCDEVIAAAKIDTKELSATIRSTLQERARKKAVQGWLAALV